ncbi:hypothetical protein BDK51DRAFT_31016 [Blyttiomyces helicus]|uniref:Uncharacterized protein n=1 Tax=Blyttiomyces helicus TaxID=388810 RepID=A0A4P9WND8_9FUNG|nr:hypothetical protein BDK51DRAFT_31016 [Blyttiomyces helicus]|eukprot:RKO94619.1 hypothetical protein BDK51DRAFT_31016 [Blyttiomyces helicus]
MLLRSIYNNYLPLMDKYTPCLGALGAPVTDADQNVSKYYSKILNSVHVIPLSQWFDLVTKVPTFGTGKHTKWNSYWHIRVEWCCLGCLDGESPDASCRRLAKPKPIDIPSWWRPHLGIIIILYLHPNLEGDIDTSTLTPWPEALKSQGAGIGSHGVEGGFMVFAFDSLVITVEMGAADYGVGREGTFHKFFVLFGLLFVTFGLADLTNDPWGWAISNTTVLYWFKICWVLGISGADIAGLLFAGLLTSINQ